MSDENGTSVSQDEREYIQDPIEDTEEMKKVFVRGINNDKTKEEVCKFFEDLMGGKVEAQIIVNKDPKKPNFGFLTFQSSNTVDELLLRRKELTFAGRTLEVNRAVPKNMTAPGAHEKLKKLFVANLPRHDCSEDDLRKYFEDRHPPKYGTIENVQLIKKKDESGNKLEENKGYGFVIVSSEDMADKMQIQHATFDFKGRRVELKKSVSNSQGGRGGQGGGYGKGYGNQYSAQDFQQDTYGGNWDGGWYDYSTGWDGYGYGGGYGGGYGQQVPAGPTGGRGGRGGGRGGGNQRFAPYKR